MMTVVLYARVSSEKQAQTDTIASQVSALENRIYADGYMLLDEHKFIDNGYSGSHLIRPALERLRDKVANSEVDKIYIHSPDRLARKYAYQMILLEEFQKAGAEIIFLNCQTNDNPESHLLLQMQGMIAEYERAKIVERHRRGKLHAAKSGFVNVLSAAPYGYRYIDKYQGGGQALFQIHAEEAEVVQKVFSWVGQDRLSIGEVRRRLNQQYPATQRGNTCWHRSVIWGMLKNSAYKGQAAFGKTKVGNRQKKIRPAKNSCEQPKRNHSIFAVEKEDWIYIPVPALIDEALFEVVQEQLAENRKIARARQKTAFHLLQGLLVCKNCHYAYYGKPIIKKRDSGKIDSYFYYRCTGTDSYRFGGNRVCNSKQIRTEVLDIVVWEEVKYLLRDPNRILNEYQERISNLERSSLDYSSESLEQQENQLKRGIARLIDSYAQEHISQAEFAPRIKAMKNRLKIIGEHKKKIADQKNLKNELTLVITSLERFASSVETSLEQLDWHTKRDIIRILVKRIEIGDEEVNVVFRVKELPDTNERTKGNSPESLQHCWRSTGSSAV